MNEVSLAPPQASTFAGPVDTIYSALWAMSGFFVVLIFLLIAIFMIKYRRSKRPETPPKTKTLLPLELGWCLVPLIGGLTFFFWGSNLYLKMYSAAPEDSYEVYGIGKQWMWKFQHPSGQREINELHVPLGERIKLTMISQDVIHSFYVPAFRLKHDILPMKYIQAWFETTKEGSYHLFCAEYCGLNHSQMIGRVIVQKPSEFEQWLTFSPTEKAPADVGQTLLQDLGCRACHQAEATAIAPRLEGIFGKTVPLADGTVVTADENYIRESILEPQAKVVANYQPVMPSYSGRITEEELMAIVAYIKSLGEQP